MYLEGQLPLGPDSSNLGGAVDTNPAAVSSTDIGAYTIPGGGTDLVSGSVANVNGIVQPPVQQPIAQSTPLQMGGSGSYGDCGDYASDGSLASIRNRAGRGMGDCQSGHQAVSQPSIAPSGGLLALAGGLLLVIFGLGGER